MFALHIYGQNMYVLQKELAQMSFPGRREAPNILHPPFEGSRPPTQLTNPSHKSQLSRAINYVSSERESGVTPVQWSGWRFDMQHLSWELYSPVAKIFTMKCSAGFEMHGNE